MQAGIFAGEEALCANEALEPAAPKLPCNQAKIVQIRQIPGQQLLADLGICRADRT
jgi:hypothetical protein